MARRAKGKGIFVTVSAVGFGSKGAKKAEFVKREIATALGNIGAFNVTTKGDFLNGNGLSLDLERTNALAGYAAEGLNIYVEVDD